MLLQVLHSRLKAQIQHEQRNTVGNIRRSLAGEATGTAAPSASPAIPAAAAAAIAVHRGAIGRAFPVAALGAGRLAAAVLVLAPAMAVAAVVAGRVLACVAGVVAPPVAVAVGVAAAVGVLFFAAAVVVALVIVLPVVAAAAVVLAGIGRSVGHGFFFFFGDLASRKKEKNRFQRSRKGGLAPDGCLVRKCNAKLTTAAPTYL